MYSYADPAAPPVNEETVGHLRQRLNVMRDIVKVRSLQESIHKETRTSFFSLSSGNGSCIFPKGSHYISLPGASFSKEHLQDHH